MPLATGMEKVPRNGKSVVAGQHPIHTFATPHDLRFFSDVPEARNSEHLGNSRTSNNSSGPHCCYVTGLKRKGPHAAHHFSVSRSSL